MCEYYLAQNSDGTNYMWYTAACNVKLICSICNWNLDLQTPTVS